MTIRGKSTSRLGIGCTLLLVALGLGCPAAAVASSSIAQGFQAGSSGIVSGALVSLRAGSASTVELSTIQNRERLLGVAAGKQSLIEFANGSPVQVVTSGATPALVSDINGAIKGGDRITSSPITGVGMKATESSLVVGSAQDDMQLGGAETRTIKTLSGQSKTVHIGAVSMLVTPVYYQANAGNSFVPSVFQEFAANLAGHTVSPLRVLISGLLVMLLFVVVGILLYSSVRSSIISIGRNPLSERAVQKSLLEVGITVVGILAFTIIVVYLILTT